MIELRSIRQRIAARWCANAFGVAQAKSLPQRGLRGFEEWTELCQACGCDPAQLHHLIDFVYARPPGTIRQELGGVGLCALALADAADLDADACEMQEVDRVLRKPIEYFTERNDAKNDAGFLAGDAMERHIGEV